jgi:hypothetical protein
VEVGVESVLGADELAAPLFDVDVAGEAIVQDDTHAFLDELRGSDQEVPGSCVSRFDHASGGAKDVAGKNERGSVVAAAPVELCIEVAVPERADSSESDQGASRTCSYVGMEDSLSSCLRSSRPASS